jgi:hypothetical protein
VVPKHRYSQQTVLNFTSGHGRPIRVRPKPQVTQVLQPSQVSDSSSTGRILHLMDRGSSPGFPAIQPNPQVPSQATEGPSQGHTHSPGLAETVMVFAPIDSPGGSTSQAPTTSGPALAPNVPQSPDSSQSSADCMAPVSRTIAQANISAGPARSI